VEEVDLEPTRRDDSDEGRALLLRHLGHVERETALSTEFGHGTLHRRAQGHVGMRHLSPHRRERTSRWVTLLGIGNSNRHGPAVEEQQVEHEGAVQLVDTSGSRSFG
jgi:hypothetical protein